MLRARLVTAAVAIPILIWLIFWAPLWVLRPVVLAFTFIALVEYFGMAFPENPLLQGAGIFSGALVAVGMASLSVENGQIGIPSSGFSAPLMALVVIGLIATLFLPEDPAEAIRRLSQTVLGVLYAGAFLPHFIWLRSGVGESGPAWVCFVIAVSMAGDSAAYFTGRSLGRRLLLPSVSPKKTVEGAIGAVGGNLLAGAIVKAALLPEAGWWEVLWLSLAAGALAQVGDLCESLVKRSFGAKDSGWLFPGHGGVLDRADSLVFPTVFVYYYVTFAHA